jgi:hypothetical protein
MTASPIKLVSLYLFAPWAGVAFFGFCLWKWRERKTRMEKLKEEEIHKR